MRTARVAGLVMAAIGLLGVLPAAASTADIRDACGDAESYVEVEGTRHTLEGSQGHVDIDGGSLAGIYDGETLTGIKATIDVCGAVSAADGAYQVALRFDDACAQRFSWTARVRDDVGSGDYTNVSPSPHAVVDEYCSKFNSRPTSPSSQQVFRANLPADAVTFEGSTVTFTVPLEAIPEVGRARYVDDTRIHVSALAMDQTLNGGVFSAGDGPDSAVWTRTDLASASQPYFVGRDRP